MVRIMLKVNDVIKVHLFDTNNKEIKTRNFNKTFVVYEKNRKLGIDWNTEKRPYVSEGEVFCPFETFDYTVVFENVATNENFRFSNIKNDIERIA